MSDETGDSEGRPTGDTHGRPTGDTQPPPVDAPPTQADTTPTHADDLLTLLSSKVVGQPTALEYIVPSIQLYRSGLAPEGCPVGVFLLLGPTGTGKTRTVEALAEVLHGSPHKVLKVDCGEFQSEHEVAKLIGAPPGYVGHSETRPRLTQQELKLVTSEDCELALVLFDEIEESGSLARSTPAGHPGPGHPQARRRIYGQLRGLSDLPDEQPRCPPDDGGAQADARLRHPPATEPYRAHGTSGKGWLGGGPEALLTRIREPDRFGRYVPSACGRLSGRDSRPPHPGAPAPRAFTARHPLVRDRGRASRSLFHTGSRHERGVRSARDQKGHSPAPHAASRGGSSQRPDPPGLQRDRGPR